MLASYARRPLIGAKLMHAWVLEQLGGPERLRWLESETPEPGPGQVRVRIEAAALNFLDTLMLQGRYQFKPQLPFTPGVELAGVVEAVGADVNLPVGTAVVAVAQTGAFATHIVLDARAVIALPAQVKAEIAASLPIVYPTAWLALYELGQLQAGERVLISAAAGGVGLAAIQLACARGAIVVALASPGKHQQCLQAGASACFDYPQVTQGDALKAWLKAQGAEGFDVVLDMVGGEVAQASIKRLAWMGRYLSVGYAGGDIPAIPANLLLLKQASAIGVWWGEYVKRNPKGATRIFGELLGMLSSGALKPVVSSVRPMAELPQALSELAERQSTGKLVVTN
jgi:NADPH2:quinone reductase